MKKIILFMLAACLISSCGVQQFAINTSVQPFQNGGIVFGERTTGLEVQKKYDFFVFGINVFNCNTKRMAEDLKATSYTIENKTNLLTGLVHYCSFGVLNMQRVKVIKRDK